jgi:hypothetical protein
MDMSRKFQTPVSAKSAPGTHSIGQVGPAAGLGTFGEHKNWPWQKLNHNSLVVQPIA